LASESISAATGRSKVSTGYARLDKALGGGFLVGSAIVLCAPASDEVPLLVRSFLKSAHGEGLLLCRALPAGDPTSQHVSDNPKVLVYGESVPLSRNVIPGKSIDNLTEVSLQINDTLKAIEPERVVLEILSEVLLRHKALLTRKWLSQLLARFRSRGITTLAVLNPFMHAKEDVEAIVDLFDGNLELIEQNVQGTIRKYLRVKWMHGIELAEKEFPLLGVGTETKIQSFEITVPATAFNEPRWKTALVNRSEELSKLRRTFDSASANGSNVIALRGEAGVGKTRLMHELAVYAQASGATVLSGRAMQNALPYASWVGVTKQYMASVPREILRHMLGANVYGLAKLVPDIVSELGPPSFLVEEQDKLRFYETVSQFFAAICDERPLLLLFDDMQHADQASLDLLEYFVRSRSSIPVLTVCSSPPPLPDETSPLEQIFLKLNQERMLETVVVKNLGKPETLELAKQVLGQESISPDFSDLLYQHTGGNPFFIEEILRALVEDGTIFRTDKGWDHKPIRDIAMPMTVKSALKVRLSKLDADTLSLLQWAAVVGVEFDFEVLGEAAQLSDDDLLKKLEIAIKRGLFIEVPEQTNRFRFADQRIRELLLVDLIQLKQKRYHLKIAEAMEKIYAKNPESQAELIAAHYFGAQDKERAVKYSIMAGDRNKSIHAYQQAINDYLRVLELIHEGADGEKAAILEKLAGTYSLASQFENSIEFYSRALALLEKLHDFESCARITPELSWAVRRARGVRDAVQVSRNGLKYVVGAPESFQAATVYSNLGSWLSILDEREEGNKWMERAREVGEKTGNFAAVSDALFHVGGYLADTGQVDEGLSLMNKGLELTLQRPSYYQARERDLLNLAFYTYPRSLVRARDLASQLFDLGKRDNDVYNQATGLVMLSVFDWIGGNWSLALEEGNKAFEMQARLGFVLRLAAEAWMGRLHLGLGDLDQAERSIQAAFAKESPKIASIVEANLALGLLRMEQDKINEAKTHFDTCVSAFKNAEFNSLPLLYIETLLQLSSIHASLGSRGEAARMAEWARRLAETIKSTAGLAMAWQAEGNILHASGNEKEAQEAYSRSLSLWEKAGWPYYQAKLLVAYSEAVAQTNSEESRKLLQRASEIFGKLGAKRDLERTERKLKP
jgi:predicted ATPase